MCNTSRSTSFMLCGSRYFSLITQEFQVKCKAHSFGRISLCPKAKRLITYPRNIKGVWKQKCLLLFFVALSTFDYYRFTSIPPTSFSFILASLSSVTDYINRVLSWPRVKLPTLLQHLFALALECGNKLLDMENLLCWKCVKLAYMVIKFA